jgi:CDP-diacylglycerol--glycerol-3-phosphate 3-phosphatidyltransferase
MARQPTTRAAPRGNYKDEARRIAARSMQQLGQTKVTPDMLSLSGLGLCVAGSVAVYFEYRAWWLYLVGAALFVLGAVLDILDGALARAGGKGTPFGAFLDSTLDRVVDMGLFLGLAMHFATAGDPGHVLLAGYALVATVLVSYAQARAELVVPKFRVGILERAERVAILAAGALTGLVIPALWVIAVGSTVTVAQRFARAYQEMERIDASERAALRERS